MQNMIDSPDNQIEGQMSLGDLYNPKDRLIAVSRIFAEARKEMSLAEQKCFVYALTQLKFTEQASSPYVYMDKKELAHIVGVESDTDHLSVDLKRAIGKLPKHSFIEIDNPEIDLYTSGTFIRTIAMFKNQVRVKFEEDYLGLFTGLTTDYITMWSSDIFQMDSIRSVQFYEHLRSITIPNQNVNTVLIGIQKFKEMFNIPLDGKGSYMREKSGFDRNNFERYVINPLCEDLQKCRMINLVYTNGKPYEKEKKNGMVLGYRFYWTFSSHPKVATAAEVKEIQERIDKNPEVLKVAKDIVDSKGKPKKQDGRGHNGTPDTEARQEDYNELLERFAKN